MDIVLALAVSTHLGMNGNYNGIHPHIRLSQDGFIAGAYYNSVRNPSLYGGYRLEGDNLGVEFAVATGYDNLAKVAPYLRVTYDIENTRIFFAPSAEKQNKELHLGAVLGVELLF